MRKKNHIDPLDKVKGLARTAKTADWQQVVLNGGPPCFHVENGQFCLRAKRWQGHGLDDFHPFVSLEGLFRLLMPQIESDRRRLLEPIWKATQPSAPDFLKWIADRLVDVYGENENIDFVRAVRKIEAAIRAAGKRRRRALQIERGKNDVSR